MVSDSDMGTSTGTRQELGGAASCCS